MTERESKAAAAKTLADFVSSEIAAAAQRRASIDSRALALITANFAMTTFFFAVKAQLGSPTHSLEGWVKTFTAVGATVSIASIGLALRSALPRKLHAADPETLKKMLAEIASDQHDDVLAEITEAQIKLLDEGHKVNDTKAYEARRSLVVLALVILLYVVAGCLQVS